MNSPEIKEFIRNTRKTEERKYIQNKMVEFLSAKATLDAKWFICQQLWYLGSSEAFPVFEKYLLDDQTAYLPN